MSACGWLRSQVEAVVHLVMVLVLPAQFLLAMFVFMVNLQVLGLTTLVSFLLGRGLSRSFKTLHSDDDVVALVKYAAGNVLRVEEHFLRTEDGILLKIHRVVPLKRDPTKGVHTVAFLQSGIAETSMTWVFNGGEDCLAGQLAKAGIDVWLGNNRGSNFADVSSAKDKDYWSFDQMAQYDFPNMIDYILGVTKASHLTVVGQSQGGTQMLGALSINAHLNRKVNKLILLAPGIVFKTPNNISLFTRLSIAACCISPYTSYSIQKFIHVLQYSAPHFLRRLFGPLITRLLGFHCTQLGGCHYAQALLYRNISGGFQSFGNFRHWRQLMEGGRPIGPYIADKHTTVIRLTRRSGAIVAEEMMEDNSIHSGLRTSPISSKSFDYPLQNISVPVDAYLAGSDNLFDPGAEEAYLLLSFGQRCRVCIVPEWGHLDFTYGLDRPYDFFPSIVENILAAANHPPDPNPVSSYSDTFSKMTLTGLSPFEFGGGGAHDHIHLVFGRGLRDGSTTDSSERVDDMEDDDIDIDDDLVGGGELLKEKRRFFGIGGDSINNDNTAQHHDDDDLLITDSTASDMNESNSINGTSRLLLHHGWANNDSTPSLIRNATAIHEGEEYNCLSPYAAPLPPLSKPCWQESDCEESDYSPASFRLNYTPVTGSAKEAQEQHGDFINSNNCNNLRPSSTTSSEQHHPCHNTQQFTFTTLPSTIVNTVSAANTRRSLASVNGSLCPGTPLMRLQASLGERRLRRMAWSMDSETSKQIIHVSANNKSQQQQPTLPPAAEHHSCSKGFRLVIPVNQLHSPGHEESNT